MNSNQTASDVVAGYVRLGEDSCHRRFMVWVVGYVRIMRGLLPLKVTVRKREEKSVVRRWIQLLNSNQTASDVVTGYVRLGDDSCHRRIMVWVVGYVRSRRGLLPLKATVWKS